MACALVLAVKRSAGIRQIPQSQNDSFMLSELELGIKRNMANYK